jgi:hypothetical protein
MGSIRIVTTAIRVDYPRNPFAARYRSFRIYIDGTNAGSVKNGDSSEIEVADGEHSVRVGMDWLRSAEVEVSVHEGATITLAASMGRNPLREVIKWTFRPRRAIDLRIM